MPTAHQHPISQNGRMKHRCIVVIASLSVLVGSIESIASQPTMAKDSKPPATKPPATKPPTTKSPTAKPPVNKPPANKPPTAKTIATVPFCEIVKTPTKYLNTMTQIVAEISLTEDSGPYLSDSACPLARDDAIGVGIPAEEDSTGDPSANGNGTFRDMMVELAKPEYGRHAIIQVTGILNDAPVRGFAWYRYRFDITHVVSLLPRIDPYTGELMAGFTYRATVRPDKVFGLVLLPPVRMIPHQAIRVEWENLSKYPSLKRNRKHPLLQQEVDFVVLQDDIVQVSQNRWNRTIRCKIIRV
jgi:hypothetical protein